MKVLYRICLSGFKYCLLFMMATWFITGFDKEVEVYILLVQMISHSIPIYLILAATGFIPCIPYISTP